MEPKDIQQVADMVLRPFYVQPDFWINVLLGAVGVIFSLLAFVEARRAKIAASEAGKTVKIQTITIELSEIAQRLDKLDFQLSFYEARDLLNEISRRLRRLIAPFQALEDLKAPCASLKTSLDAAKQALEGLLPQEGGVDQLPLNSVYFATQGHFANISSQVAEIMGLFEKRTINVDD